MVKGKPESVRVAIRFRPLFPNEQAQIAQQHLQADPFRVEGNSVHDTVGGKGPFSFDTVLGPETTQEESYRQIARGHVKDLLDGFDCTIFAYGQTGAGKTFTMMGPPDQPGIVPQFMDEMFAAIKSYGADRQHMSHRYKERSVKVAAGRAPAGHTGQVRCAMFEIYNETCTDLITGQGVTVHLIKKEVEVRGVSWHECRNAAEIQDFIKVGDKNRTVGEHLLNKDSSRSHSILQCKIEVRDSAGELTASPMLCLADLAGSERRNKTGAEGQRAVEGNYINLSLLSLVECISTLVRGGAHVPYRNSVLTSVLKNALGGDSKVSLIVACNPSPLYRDETIGSLRFGRNCKLVKQLVVQKTQKTVTELQQEIDRLMKENAELKSLLAQYEEHYRTHYPADRWQPTRGLVLDEDSEPGQGLKAVSTEIQDVEEDIKELQAILDAMPDVPDGEKQDELNMMAELKKKMVKLKMDQDIEGVKYDLRDSVVRAAAGGTEAIEAYQLVTSERDEALAKVEVLTDELGAAKAKVNQLEESTSMLRAKTDIINRMAGQYVDKAKQEKATLKENMQADLDAAEKRLEELAAARKECEERLAQMAETHTNELSEQGKRAAADQGRLRGQVDELMEAMKRLQTASQEDSAALAQAQSDAEAAKVAAEKAAQDAAASMEQAQAIAAEAIAEASEQADAQAQAKAAAAKSAADAAVASASKAAENAVAAAEQAKAEAIEAANKNAAAKAKSSADTAERVIQEREAAWERDREVQREQLAELTRRCSEWKFTAQMYRAQLDTAKAKHHQQLEDDAAQHSDQLHALKADLDEAEQKLKESNATRKECAQRIEAMVEAHTKEVAEQNKQAATTQARLAGEVDALMQAMSRLKSANHEDSVALAQAQSDAEAAKVAAEKAAQDAAASMKQAQARAAKAIEDASKQAETQAQAKAAAAKSAADAAVASASKAAENAVAAAEQAKAEAIEAANKHAAAKAKADADTAERVIQEREAAWERDREVQREQLNDIEHKCNEWKFTAQLYKTQLEAANDKINMMLKAVNQIDVGLFFEPIEDQE